MKQVIARGILALLAIFAIALIVFALAVNLGWKNALIGFIGAVVLVTAYAWAMLNA